MSLQPKSSILSLILLSAVPASAQAADLTTDSRSSGQSQADSPNYVLDAAIDPASGPLANSANYALKAGFTGQLYDPVALTVSPLQSQADELASNQMEAEAVMDDGTKLHLDPAEVTWEARSGPVAGITAQGSVLTSAVFEMSPASVRGAWGGLFDDITFAVRDSDDDNFGPVAGDGVNDGWQYFYFDLDANGELDPDETEQADPELDPDGDGQNNLFESLSGHAPDDGNDRLQVTISGRTESRMTLHFSKVVPGTNYTLMGAGEGFALSQDWDLLQPAFELKSEKTDHEVSIEGELVERIFFRFLLEKAPQ